MSKKSDLKKAIKASEEEIENLEKKRLRSQSQLLNNMLANTEPSEADKEYYKVYTQLIDLERENLRKLREELDQL